MNTKILLKTESILASYSKQESSSSLVITFSYFNWGGFKEYGFSELYWIKKGFSVLSFQNIENDWFNSLGVDEINDCLLQFDLGSFSERILYGSSMGGFAAFAFSGIFNATKVIAFSPQFSIEKDWDTRWRFSLKGSKHRHLIENNRNSAINAKCLIIYDSTSLDRLHVSNICSVFTNVQTFALPNTNHSPSVVLAELNLLDRIQDDFIYGNSLDEYFNIYRENRFNSLFYKHNFARRLSSRSHEKSIQSRRYIFKNPDIIDYDSKLLKVIIARHLDVSTPLENIVDHPRHEVIKYMMEGKIMSKINNISAVTFEYLAADNFNFNFSFFINYYDWTCFSFNISNKFLAKFKLYCSSVDLYAEILVDTSCDLIINTNKDAFMTLQRNNEAYSSINFYINTKPQLFNFRMEGV